MKLYAHIRDLNSTEVAFSLSTQKSIRLFNVVVVVNTNTTGINTIIKSAAAQINEQLGKTAHYEN